MVYLVCLMELPHSFNITSDNKLASLCTVQFPSVAFLTKPTSLHLVLCKYNTTAMSTPHTSGKGAIHNQSGEQKFRDNQANGKIMIIKFSFIPKTTELTVRVYFKETFRKRNACFINPVRNIYP